MVDTKGRRVNPAGYLVDTQGNIVYKGGPKIVFAAAQLMFNEPPKLFDFTRFDINDVQADGGKRRTSQKPRPLLNRDINLSISDYGDDGVNTCGYIIDDHGNILDRRSHGIVFRREVLDIVRDFNGAMVQAELPLVFRDP